MESRFGHVENAEIGSKSRCALLPFHHREELGEWAPQMPRCLRCRLAVDAVEAGMPVECAGVGEGLRVRDKEKFPACAFSSCTAPLVHKGKMLLSAQGSMFKRHFALDSVPQNRQKPTYSE